MNSTLPSLDTIRQVANGNWPNILQALGVHSDHLNTRKHSSCPHCGGHDRYRFTGYKDNGGFICNQCTPDGGSGFDLLMLVHGYDFASAVKDVSIYLGLDRSTSAPYRAPAPAPAPTTPPCIERTDDQPKLLALLGECQPVTENTPVARYLMARGLDWQVIACDLQNLFYHPALPYWYATKPKGVALLARYPAMIAAIHDEQGTLVGLHKTYLEPDDQGHYRKLSALHPDDGKTLAAKKMQSRYQGSLKGAAIKLYSLSPEEDNLAVCEGMETALAVRELFGLPVYACATAWGMENVAFPAWLKTLYVVADNDLSQTGFKAAHHLGIRGIKAGLKVHLWQPQEVGDDALDELNRRKNTQRGGARA